MKNYLSLSQFPKTFKVSNGLRALLLLGALALVSCLPFYVFAESQPARVLASATAIDESVDNSEVFVFYRDTNGESVCRKANLAEQASLLERDGAGPANTIYTGGRRVSKGSGESPMMTATGKTLLPSAGLRIVLHATTQLQNDPVARDAFIVAANRWEALISTPITVVLDVDYGSTFFGQPWGSPGILGATATTNINTVFSNVRSPLVNTANGAEETQLYNALPAATVFVELNATNIDIANMRITRTVARAIGLSPDISNPDSLAIGQGDAGIGFNSAHTFDFDPENGISAGTLDFDAVVVHEIGHALGFTSRSGDGVTAPISMWDLFRFRPGAASLGTMPTARRVMTEGGEQVFFNNRPNSFGSMELALSTGGSDGVGGDGAQSSHWQDDRFYAFIGIMDPRLKSGQREVITSNDLLALDTFGYTISGTAPPPRPPAPPPVNDNFSAAIALNPLSDSITGTNAGATKEVGEGPFGGGCGTVKKSVWYSWTPTVSSTAVFDTIGSAYDTYLSVYEGNAVNSISAVASNDDAQSGVNYSRVTFNTQAGKTYRIAVDGFDCDTGTFNLNWTIPEARKIAGRVTNENGNPISGLPVYLSDSQSLVVNTNSNGEYAFTNLSHARRYSVRPEQQQGGFIGWTPASHLFESLTSDQTANFVRYVVPSFIVSGRVTHADGYVMPNIAIRVPGARTPVNLFTIPDARTDANGNYSFQLEAGRTYEVTPVDPNYSYTPTAFTFANLSANQTANFTASRRIYNIVGRVLENGVGLGDVTMTLRLGSTGLTRTANTGSDGIYRFDDVPLVGSYGFSPQKFSYIFNPLGYGTSSVFAGVIDFHGTKVHPIETSDFFVRQHYLDFLNRPGDSSGVQFWVGGVEQCGFNSVCRDFMRIQTSAAFFLSIEFQETGYMVYRMYKTAYGNLPGGAPVPVRLAEFLPDTRQIGQGVVVGVGNWQALLESNKQAFALDFVTRSRFTDAFAASLTPTQFVNALFANAGVTPSGSELNAAVAEFGAATTSNDNSARARVLRLVADHAQLKSLEFNRAFVLMQYFGYLQRNPYDSPEPTLDFGGYNFWLNKLNQFNGNYVSAEMVRAFIISSEYRQRF